MDYKKIIVLCFLPFFLYASQKKVATQELFDYSSLQINKNVHMYAAKVNMQSFEDTKAYAIGLLHQNKALNTEIGVGYMQPADQIDALLDPANPKTLSANEEGFLFFMNCHF